MAAALTQGLSSRHLALNPEMNVWVSASAGTGKTKILTDRILMLLLAGEDPQKILCLTFTKAAAAEMKGRLLQYTLEWATCSEASLHEKLTDFLGGIPSQDQKEKARSLFMSLIGVTPGVRITTIHSFCQSLLMQFPVEAGISPFFRILAEHESQKLLKNAVEETLTFSATFSSLKESITLLTERCHVSTFTEIIEDLIGRPERLQKILRKRNETNYYGLEEIFGCHQAEKIEDSIKLFHELQKERALDLQNASSCLMEGGKTDIARGEAMQAWMALKEVPTLEDFNSYASHFLTIEGDIRKTLVSVGVSQNYPSITEYLIKEAYLLWEVVQKQKSLFNMKMTKALYDLGAAILENYEYQKVAQHSLDYNDLIYKAKSLLTHHELAAWVLYKLDGGINHILVDEAQDTNEAQWEIIHALTEEFYAGESARSVSRTLFAVGDPKQSIYSFQGTSPAIFKQKNTFYHHRIQEAQKNFCTLSLEKSFRSTPVILEVVNALCSHEEIKTSINALDKEALHISHHEQKGGTVELWPLIEVDNKEIKGREQLSICLAKKIKTWLDQKLYLEMQDRSVEASDILILLRERGSLMTTLISALKALGIPVAGPDRLTLLNEIVIQDLIALGEFLLLPEDDLNFACVLKSPLIALTEEDLFNLAYNRQGETLWARFQQSTQYQTHLDFLLELRNKVDYVGPFALYADLLNRLKGRKKFHARLGEECLDAIEEFLTLCLEYERTQCASLQGFLSWVKTIDIEIKRDFSKANSGVRVMTVHGAKGLQAPIVILAETTTKPIWRDKFLWQEKPHPLLLWASSQEELPHHLKKVKETLQAEQLDEYWRLLYVAMTRAEEHLYIAGVKSRTAATGSWYDILSKVLEPISQKIDFQEDFLKGQGLKLYKPCQTEREASLNKEASIDQSYSLPAYLQRPPAYEELSNDPISHLIEESIFRKEYTDKELQKDILCKLLKHLPFCLPETYDTEAQKIFKQFYFSVPKILFEQCYKIAWNLLNHQKLNFLFIPTAYTDVPFAGYYQGKQVTGVFDRIVVLDQVAHVIIYKIEEDLLSQDKKEMVIYQSIAQNLFPGKIIRVFFLKVTTRDLIEFEN
ncbi:MAG: double-strand break repair helicase AddA [Caedibacter sp. 37-49]|mgnify:CR=1 FL=1|nr:MAG: double-strand break repair helicase AddA [Caedibacter sp. 37-49]